VTLAGPTDAAVVHDSPGRLRLKLPDRKGDEAFLTELADRLLGVDGVHEVRANPLTGSVLLLHHGADSGALKAALADGNLVRIVEPGYLLLEQPRDEHGPEWRTVLFMGLLVLGIFQIARGQALAPAATLFWMASELVSRGKSGDPDSTSDAP
jgi:hypothetical protein